MELKIIHAGSQQRSILPFMSQVVSLVSHLKSIILLARNQSKSHEESFSG